MLQTLIHKNMFGKQEEARFLTISSLRILKDQLMNLSIIYTRDSSNTIFWVLSHLSVRVLYQPFKIKWCSNGAGN